MLVVWTGIASSCKYDDDELWGSVDDLANRISAMETLTQQMNGDIAALQAIVTAVENQVSVSEVEKLTDGYILHFTNGQTATIKNGTDGEDGKDGENGQDGTDGEDGIDGKDGQDAPYIYIAKDNGIYYWTITVNGKTEWLTDDAGNKLPVTGADGADGEDGKDGYGSSGAAGQDGRTPTLKIDEQGNWMVSYDGTNFFPVVGSANAYGEKGQDGTEVFESVKSTTDGERLVIKMKTGEEFVLNLVKLITYYKIVDNKKEEIDDTKNILWNGEQEFEFTFDLQLKNAKCAVVIEEGIQVEQPDFENKTISLKSINSSLDEVRAVVLFFNETQTITSVFKFKTAPWNGSDSSPVTPINNVYKIATPSNLRYIAALVNNGNSLAGMTIKLINDVDLGGKEWTPIGQDSNYPFSGTFDGNGKTIKGLSVGNTVIAKSLSRAPEGVKGTGLFGVVKDAVLRAVTIADAIIKSSDSKGVGVLVGCALDKVTIENVTIAKETPKEPSEEISKDVTGSQNVGSVAGYISGNDIKISECTVTSTSLSASSEQTSASESSSVGGVVGTINITSSDATIEISNCTVGGVDLESASSSSESGEDTPTGNNTVGGVVGSLTTSSDDINIESVDMSKVTNNTVADATVIVPEGTDAEDVEFDALVGNSSSLGDNVKESINSGNETLDIVVDAFTTIRNAELSTVLLAELGADKVTLENGFAKMKISDVEAVTELDFRNKNYTITSLSPEDIGKFKNLQRLDCRNTKLAECDLSQNKELVYVNIQNNVMAELDFSQNEKLNQLICSNNKNLTSLILDNCNQLHNLQTQSTSISSLNIPNKKAMTNFHYGDTNLSNVIDLTEFTNLTGLCIKKMGYTSLDFIPDNVKANLHTLFCESNDITSVDLTKFPNLSTLYLHGNKIETLDVSMLSHLESFYCGNQQNNGILILTISTEQQNMWNTQWNTQSPNVYLRDEVIIIENTDFSAALYSVLGSDKVNLISSGYAVMTKKNAESITELNFGYSGNYKISSLMGIEHFTNLTTLVCTAAQMNECDLSKNAALKTLDLSFNNFTDLDLNANKELETVRLSSCRQLTSLKMDACSKLLDVTVNYCTGLSGITLPNQANLRTLDYAGTNLSFDFNQLSSLTSLNCANTNITNLDFLPKALKDQLESLNCAGNSLQALNLEGYPNLKYLYCNNNALTSLDITSLSNLIDLVCGYQMNNVVLKLKLTEPQKEQWNSTWGTNGNNKNVELHVEASIGTGSGNDFGSGGEF